MKCLLAAAIIAAVPATAVQAATVDSEIRIAFTGIPIGRMKATLTTDGASYTYSGNAKTSGLVKVVVPTKAYFDASGRISGRKVVPTRHNTNYRQRKKEGRLTLGFSGGRITSTQNVPAVKYKDGTVPVKASHLSGVLDPVAALVVPVKAGEVGNGKAICNRTIPVFDGKNRFDLKLSYAGQSNGRAKGFSGPVFKCALRYKAVSGHRPFKKNVKFWNANRDASITLAQIGNAPVYGLFGFDVRTQQGRATGTAKKFSSK
ncbi:MAG: DUF3108 domain-containing protein [Pseudomonadota bacterium]